MAQNGVDNIVREYAPNADQNLLALYKRLAYAYGTVELPNGKKYGPGLLSENEVSEIQSMDAPRAIQEMFNTKDLPNLNDNQWLEFCDIFVGDDMENFNGATPAILAGAYRAIRERAKNDSSQSVRLEKLAAYIDRESADFANSNGMIVGGAVVDTANIADVYAGFMDMLNARRTDLDESMDSGKIAQINANIAHLESVIGEYDKNWGLDNLSPSNAKKLAKRWDKLTDAVSHANMLPDTKNIAKKFKFYDENGQEISQFLSDGRVDKNGRLSAVWDASCIDTAKRHVAKTEESIDANALELEINQDVLFKLQAMATTSDAINMSMDDVEKLADPAEYEKAVRELDVQKPYGGIITNETYNTAMDVQANANAGWGARVKSKIGRVASKVRGFFAKYTRSTEKIDALSDTRMGREATTKRKKRIQLFGGVLRGFASGFVASALITTIATAAAAATGMTMAAALAMIGGGLALGIVTAQILRWYREQKNAGKPATFREFRKNRQLITSIAVSAIASAAMGLAAGGFATAAMAVGGVAMGAGMVNNGIATYEHLEKEDMSKTERIAWVIANATAPLAGGLTGRVAANSFINWYNQQNPENTIFQNTAERATEQKISRDVIERQYDPAAIEHHKEMMLKYHWETPESFDVRVNGLMDNGLTYDESVRYLLAWHDATDHNLGGGYFKGIGMSSSELAALRASIDGNTVNITPDSLAAFKVVDPKISPINQVGHTPGTVPTTKLPSNATMGPDGRYVYDAANNNVYHTYADGTSAFQDVKVPVTDIVQGSETVYNQVSTDPVMAAYGVYTPGEQRTLRDRIGAFLGRTKGAKPAPNKPEDNWTDDDVVPVLGDTHDDVEQNKDEKDNNNEDIFAVPVYEEPEQLTDDNKHDELSAGGALVPTGAKLPSIDKVLGTDKNNIVIDIPKPKLLEAGRKQQQERELRFGLTYQQAKAYNDLVQNIERETRKKNFDPKKITRWKQELQEMYNKYGRPDSIEYEIARREAYAREEIDTKLLPQLDNVQADIRNISLEMSELLKQRPDADVSEPGALAKWQKKYDKKARKSERLRKQESRVEKKIKELGGLALLDTSDLYFPSPVKSESRRRKEEKWARMDVEKAERDANAAVAAEMARAEGEAHVQQKAKEEKGEKQEVNLIQPEIIKPVEIKNPFELLDDMHGDEPEQDQIMAVAGNVSHIPTPVVPEHVPVAVVETPKEPEVNVSKLLKQFDIKEPVIEKAPKTLDFEPEITKIRGSSVKLLPVSGNGVYIAQNHGVAIVLADVDGINIPFYLDSVHHMWRPIYRFNRNGKLYLGDSVNQYHPAEIIQIAGALGGELGTELPADSLPDLDINIIADAVLKPTKNNSQAYGLYSGGAIYVEGGVLKHALAEVGEPEVKKSNVLRRWLSGRGIQGGHK